MTELPAPEGDIWALNHLDDSDVFGTMDHDGKTADVVLSLARMGYITGDVLDLTYGQHGGFWTKYRPPGLVTNDLHHPAQHAVDYLNPDEQFHELGWFDRFDCVICDPPYKLNGTPTDSPRYGVDRPVSVAERKEGALAALWAATKLTAPGGIVVYKTANQTANGSFHDLVFDAKDFVRRLHWVCIGEMHMPHRPRSQRSQVSIRNNLSTFVLFRRPKK